ncbi:hypothetical protein [Methylobacterium tarhaniae]|uniref:hypothetical protein n=1 Tax=Methylobacterium tarhaniae TaxID=1187852 RepID=UPI0012ECE135|nr:hypothetical protein [Methylobacterium tarhaniae]
MPAMGPPVAPSSFGIRRRDDCGWGRRQGEAFPKEAGGASSLCRLARRDPGESPAGAGRGHLDRCRTQSPARSPVCRIYQREQRKQWLNDALIFLTAACAGIPVPTADRGDYDVIQQLAPEGRFVSFDL